MKLPSIKLGRQLPALAIVLIFLSVTLPAKAEDPFFRLDAFVRSKGSWGLNHAEQAKIFQEIRSGLGASFRDAVLAYVGEDLDKAYWCGNFLFQSGYLGDSEADLELAAKVLRLGLMNTYDPAALDAAQQNGFASQLGIRVQYALVQARLGRLAESHIYKNVVEDSIRLYPIYAGAFPALAPEDRRIYDSL